MRSSVMLQFASAEWVKEQDFKSNVGGVFARIAKLAEEVGELSRAIIGEIEKRPDRGDPIQEAAQAVIVLLSIFGEYYPYADLYAEVDAEMRRNGATPDVAGQTLA